MFNIVFDLTCAGPSKDVCLVPFRETGRRTVGKHLYDHQIRVFLEDAFQSMGLPYGVVTFFNPKDAQLCFDTNIMGMPESVPADWAKFVASDKVGFDKKSVADWEIVIAIPRQGKTIMVMVPKGYGAFAFKMLGIVVKMTKSDQGLKVAKYLARLIAGYKKSSFGRFIDLKDDILTVEVNGTILRFRLIGDTPYLAGSAQLTPHACNTVFGNYGQYRNGEGQLVGGRRWHDGDAGRLTFTCPEFLHKSQFLCRSLGKVDGVLPDNKVILGTDKVFIGLMDELHEPEARTNSQDSANFRQWLHLPGLTELVYHQLYGRMTDMATFIKDFANMTPYAGTDGDDGECETEAVDPLDVWLSKYAAQNGVDPTQFFGLAMRPFRQWQKMMLDPARARVVIPESVAAYLFPDHNIIDRVTGEFNLKLAKLSGNCVANPKLIAHRETALVRSPSGSPREFFMSWAAAIPDALRGEYSDSLLEVSPDMALSAYYALGGADNDDLTRAIQWAPMVDTFRNNLPAYPEKAPMQKD